MSQLIHTDIHNYVGTITIDREDKHNALNPEAIANINAAFANFTHDNNVRVIVIQSKGKSFCAGADLDWMKSSITMSKKENEDSAKALFDMYERIYHCPKPVIGRVHGSAFGGGVGLIACLDVVVMMETAVLSLSELKLGLIPSTIAPFLLRKVGFGNLKYYGLCSRRIPAEEGKTIGLIHDVVATEQALDQTIHDYIQMFLNLSPAAITRYKSMCDNIHTLSIEEARTPTSVEIADIRTTQEAQEGLTAFFEKRAANFAVGKNNDV